MDFKQICRQLKNESNPTIRQALLLSLGDFSEEDIAAGERNALVNDLREWYVHHPNPGLHGAAEWLLRQWKHDPWLKATAEKWVTERQHSEQRLEVIRHEFTKDGPGQRGPQWYVNPQGQTMVVIPSSTEFVMGSPLKEESRWSDERLRTANMSAITSPSPRSR